MVFEVGMNMTIKTIQMTFDDALLEQVDEVVETLQVSRAEFLRRAIEDALAHYRIKRLEEEHAASYIVRPQTQEEIAEWDGIRAWGDE